MIKTARNQAEVSPSFRVRFALAAHCNAISRMYAYLFLRKVTYHHSIDSQTECQPVNRWSRLLCHALFSCRLTLDNLTCQLAPLSRWDNTSMEYAARVSFTCELKAVRIIEHIFSPFVIRH